MVYIMIQVGLRNQSSEKFNSAVLEMDTYKDLQELVAINEKYTKKKNQVLQASW